MVTLGFVSPLTVGCPGAAGQTSSGAGLRPSLLSVHLLLTSAKPARRPHVPPLLQL